MSPVLNELPQFMLSAQTGAVQFCEDQQYRQVYQDAPIEYAVFEIHFANEPTEKAWEFLEQVQKQINELGITLRCHISA